MKHDLLQVVFFLLSFFKFYSLKLLYLLRSQMEIIIEYALIVNFVINYFILKSCAKLFKVQAKWWFVSCLFGSIMAVIMPLFNFPLVANIFATIFVGIIMVCISFPVKQFKDFLYYGFGLVFLTFVFGGASYLLTSWFGQLSTFIICLVSMVVYIGLSLLFKRLAKKRVIDSFTCSVQIKCKDKTVEEIGYFDSGNVLYDPITSEPIVLISKEVFEKIAGEDYLFFLLKKEKAKKLPYGHFVNVGSAVSNGQMLVFMADKLTITEKGKHAKIFKNTLLGLSMADFSKNLNSGVLLHSSLV